nr:EOG090X08PK [Cyclestheria hislopi]
MAEAKVADHVSDSSEESACEENWTLYCNRPEWKDVKPIELDEGPFPVVAIAYSERFKDVYNYFRAVIQSNEISERAFRLTTDAVELNPANYTVWQYRRILLKALGKDLHKELSYVRQIIEDHPKNYQVWHHRKVLVEWIGDPSLELRLTEIILSQDAKNYHAWQHRQWVLETYKLFEKELDFVEGLLEDDVRNNSAWTQRFYVVKQTTGFTENIINRELKYTIDSLKKLCDNESAWNYLRGVLAHYPDGLNGHSIVEELCQHFELHNNRIPFFTAFLVDRMEELMTKDKSKCKELLPKATELLQTLAMETDPIRREYWCFLSRHFNSKFNI